MPYFFQLPPITELTIPQQSVLNEGNAVYISGGPGTGKSVVSLWRHMRNHEIEDRSCVLLTYTTTLASYLASAARTTNPNAADNVFKTYEWLNNGPSHCHEIIVDEAQDLPIQTYRRLNRLGDDISYGADDQQSIYRGQQSTEAQLRALFPNNEPYILDENFRNTYEIMRFVRAALPNKLIFPQTMNRLKVARRGTTPIVIVTNGRQGVATIEIIRRYMGPAHNIAVLVPFGQSVVAYHRGITAAGIQCSRYMNEDKTLAEIDNVHVTTFASSKGTEFDTVIIPNFQDFRYNIREKYVATENHYYVALTRSRRNLFLITNEVPDDIDTRTFEIETL